MFASDYPHWDFDDPVFVRVPPEWREQVMDGNARTLYALPQPVGAHDERR